MFCCSFVFVDFIHPPRDYVSVTEISKKSKKCKTTLFQVGTVKQIKHKLLFEISASHRPESSLCTIYTTL